MKVPSKGLTKGAWTVDEDNLLRHCIDQYGEGKWHQVPRRTGLNRCRKSCRLRWLNYLKPNIKKGKFSSDEVDLLLRLHKLLGNRWSLIAGRLPDRTANDVKNYWNSHFSKTKTRKRDSSSNCVTISTAKVNVIKPQPRYIDNSCIRLDNAPSEINPNPYCQSHDELNNNNNNDNNNGDNNNNDNDNDNDNDNNNNNNNNDNDNDNDDDNNNNNDNDDDNNNNDDDNNNNNNVCVVNKESMWWENLLEEEGVEPDRILTEEIPENSCLMKSTSASFEFEFEFEFEFDQIWSLFNGESEDLNL